MQKWKLVTFAAIPLCIGMAVYDLSGKTKQQRYRSSSALQKFAFLPEEDVVTLRYAALPEGAIFLLNL